MKRALISVSDKTGVSAFARGLADLGYEIIATGGTYTALCKAGISVLRIEDITGFPECLDGRLKTLHPNIHGGILAMRENEGHMARIAELGIQPIDIVAVNLYPFKQVIQDENVAFAVAVENIDIGGPTMLRAAAKNYRDVTVLVDPRDYETILEEIKTLGRVSPETNAGMAAKAFAHTADYDAVIAAYWRQKTGLGQDKLPETLTISFEKAQDLRYGENPHQGAAFYKEVTTDPASLASMRQLHGKELSFNNIHDTHGALELLREFDKPTVVACKHANPCGVGSADTIAEAYRKAYQADPLSIFGGIVVANRELDAETATELAGIFVEIILAPRFSEEALQILKKKKNLRILQLNPKRLTKTDFDMKKVSGGLLVQETDRILLPETELKVVTERRPTDEEMADLLFAWRVVKHTKSNGIAIGKNGQSIGIGPGQVNRIWATRQAIDHAREFLGEEALKNAALASDAFFPFPDCAEAAASAGITAIIQPGGSVNDQASIDVCNQSHIAMVFTGMRHFKH